MSNEPQAAIEETKPAMNTPPVEDSEGAARRKLKAENRELTMNLLKLQEEKAATDVRMNGVLSDAKKATEDLAIAAEALLKLAHEINLLKQLLAHYMK